MIQLFNSGNKLSNCRDTYFSVWKTDGKTSGYTKSAGYLELKTVNNAGHLVPMDQGAAALNLVKSFVAKCRGTSNDIKNEWMISREQIDKRLHL